jgi:hypothetical protein
MDVSQSDYIHKILKRFYMMDCVPIFFFFYLGAILDRVMPECIGGVYIFTEYKEYKMLGNWAYLPHTGRGPVRKLREIF